jgi:hypothetical protein
MMRGASRLLIAVALTVSAPAAFTGVPAPQSGKMLFAKPVALRGSLGETQIQVNLRVKEEFEDGVEGDYFFFGQSRHILLAGEIEGDELFLEESENGTDVSGQWDGKLVGNIITGEWQSVDGKLSKPFRVAIVRKAEKAKAGNLSK